MMEQGFIAPTLNLENVDERCSMLRHTRELTDIPTPDCRHSKFCLWRSEYLSPCKKWQRCRHLIHPFSVLVDRSIDCGVTLVCWAWFTLGFLLFFSWRYLAVRPVCKRSGTLFPAAEQSVLPNIFSYRQNNRPPPETGDR